VIKRRRSAAELVAFHLCADIADVRDSEYQRGRTAVRVFTWGDDYFCAPPSGKIPPKDRTWTLAGTYYDRPVYRSSCADAG
jgi:hypothetical protein